MYTHYTIIHWGTSFSTIKSLHNLILSIAAYMQFGGIWNEGH